MNDKPGRTYIGVHTPAVSGKTSLIRLYADMLAGGIYPLCDNCHAKIGMIAGKKIQLRLN